MLTALIAALALQSAAARPVASVVPDCDYDRAAILALSPEAFDQDMNGGWRPLADKPECRGAAADLLAAYRHAHWGDLGPDQLHLNYWHEGQIRASLDQRDRAVRLLMAGVNPNDSGSGFDDYALGTVAFLRNDRPALEAARARLAALPMPDSFRRAAETFREKYGREVKWPMNLDVLDGLIACFGRSYDEAYGDCRPE